MAFQNYIMAKNTFNETIYYTIEVIYDDYYLVALIIIHVFVKSGA